MNEQRARRVIYDVARWFQAEDLADMESDRLHQEGFTGEAFFCKLGRRFGLSKSDLILGRKTVPDRVSQEYPVVSLMSDWQFSKSLAESPYSGLRMFQALFGEEAVKLKVPSLEEEQFRCHASVFERCYHKVKKINEIFPDTYPLHLPVYKINISDAKLIDFAKVKELVSSFEDVVQRFGELFFTAVRENLPKEQQLEFNLLAAFLHATDLMMPREYVSYAYMKQYREVLKKEEYSQITDYVRIRTTLRPWEARAFYKDQEYAARYIQNHPNSKRMIREFLQKASSYQCDFVFINNMEAHERIQSHPEEAACLDDVDVDLMIEEEHDENLLAPKVSPDQPYVSTEIIPVAKNSEELSEEDRLTIERGQQILDALRCIPLPVQPAVSPFDMDRIQSRINICRQHFSQQHQEKAGDSHE